MLKVTPRIEPGEPDIAPGAIAPTPVTVAPRLAAVTNALVDEGTPAATVAKAVRGLTARDLAGLNPAEVDAVVRRQIAIDAQAEELEQLIGYTGRTLSTERTAAAKQRLDTQEKRDAAMFKAKSDGAKAIAESTLPESEKRERINKLMNETNLESALTQAVEAVGLTKAPSYGADREAVSQEFYGKSYGELTQAERGEVNTAIPERTAPSLEIIRDETGAYIIDKTTGKATQITPSGQSQRLRRKGPQDPKDAGKELNLGDGSSITVVPDKRATQTKPEVTTGREAIPPQVREQSPGIVLGRATDAELDVIADGFRRMGQEQAEAYYDMIRKRDRPNDTANAKKALIRAFPSLGDKYSEVQTIPIQPVPGVTPEVATAGAAPMPVARPFLSTPPKDPKEASQDRAEARFYGERIQKANNIIEELEARGEYGNKPGLVETISKYDKSVLPAFFAGVTALITGATTRSTYGAAAGAGAGTAIGAWLDAQAKEYANSFRTPEAQRYNSARMDLVRSALRDESGASIGTIEGIEEVKRLFPERSDSPEVIRDKRERRRDLIRFLEKRSGEKWLEDKYRK